MKIILKNIQFIPNLGNACFAIDLMPKKTLPDVSTNSLLTTFIYGDINQKLHYIKINYKQ